MGLWSRNRERQEISQERHLEEVMAILGDLKKKGKIVNIGICPRCKSSQIRRVSGFGGDMSGHIALTLPKFECLECSWRGRLPLYATNRPFDKKAMDVVSDS